MGFVWVVFYRRFGLKGWLAALPGCCGWGGCGSDKSLVVESSLAVPFGAIHLLVSQFEDGIDGPGLRAGGAMYHAYGAGEIGNEGFFLFGYDFLFYEFDFLLEDFGYMYSLFIGDIGKGYDHFITTLAAEAAFLAEELSY